jgi:hypothetical protein
MDNSDVPIVPAISYKTSVVAIIHSNMGDKKISFDFISPYQVNGDSGFHSSISIDSPHWDGDDYVHPIHLKFEDFWISRERLIQMSERLLEWCGLPLNEMAATPLAARFELCRGAYPHITLGFGPREDTIDSRKPVLSVDIKIATIRVETHFVTDQSCLTIFANEVMQALETRQE